MAIDWAVGKILVLAFSGILFLSTFSIVLRWFKMSFQWIDPLVRHLVFLSIFLGAIIATSKKSHIAIDIVGRLLKARGKSREVIILRRMILVLSSLTCFWLTKASFHFFLIELEFGKKIFWGIDSGILVGIIPLAMLVLGLRFLLVLGTEIEENH